MRYRRYFLSAAAALLLAGCGTTATLERSTPDAEGVDPAAVRAFVDGLEQKMMSSGDFLNGSANAFMLLKNGKVIAEGAWAPYRLDAPRHVFSMSKSFTSVAVGFAVQEKRLSLDDTVISFFPDKLPARVSDRLASMRVRDLLTMQSGHKSDPIGKMFEAKDLVRGFLAAGLDYRPGTHFAYNNGATYMLSAILTRVTGKPVAEYLKLRLFQPLGIGEVKWEADDSGVNFGAWGLWLKPEDAAKFAQFCLNRGAWGGRQLLEERWINLATSPQCNVVAGDDKSDWSQGYGFQFWRCRNGAFRADGFLGQYAVVMENENAALIMFNASNRMQIALDVLWETLLPALRSGRAAEEELPADIELRDSLKRLALTFPEKKEASVRFRPGDRVTVTLPEGNGLKADSLELERSAESIHVKLNGFPLTYGTGGWMENPAVPKAEGTAHRDAFPIEGPLFARAFQLGADEWMLVLVSPNSAIQNFLRVKLEGMSATLEGRYNFDDRPVIVTGSAE